MAKIDFGGVMEEVVTRDEFPLEKAREVLKNETIAVIGYGVQGPAQALNMRDNGFKVIIGQSQEFKRDWDEAVKDGWVPGKTLFDIEEAARKGTIIQYLVSDAAQKAIWPKLKACLKRGRRPVLLPRLLHRLQGADRGDPAGQRRRDPGGAQGFGGQRARPTSSPAAASTPATPCSRTTPAARRSAPWPWASPSAPATCSPPPSSRKSTAT